jgi:ADP-heptose:LPS heptosyltransferase
MISMDSANMHLASLMGTRCISVWGSTHHYAGFLGYGQSEDDIVQVKDLSCRPCSVFGDKECFREIMLVSKNWTYKKLSIGYEAKYLYSCL